MCGGDDVGKCGIIHSDWKIPKHWQKPSTMREREINELILQIFEEQEELFYFPILSQKDAKAFVKALYGKGLGYEKLCDDIGESEHTFNSWRKSLGRTGVGQRVIERINQPFLDLLQEDADQLMHGTYINLQNQTPPKHQNGNGCQNGFSPKQSPARLRRESPNVHKNENESELAERLSRARNRLQLQESTKKEKKQDEDKDGSEEEVFSNFSSSHSSLVGSPKLRRDEKREERSSERERPMSQIEEVRMNLRRSSGNAESKLRDLERRGSSRDKDDITTENRSSIHGLLAKFENIADQKRQSNSVSPVDSGSKSNSEENINEVSKGQRSPSPPLKFRSPSSSPMSSRSSASPETELSPRKEFNDKKDLKESEIVKAEKVENETATTVKKESESIVKTETEIVKTSSETVETRNERESESMNRESESMNRESESMNRESESMNRESESIKRENDSTKRESDNTKRESESPERETVMKETVNNVKIESETSLMQDEGESMEAAQDADSFVTANGSHVKEEDCSFEDQENSMSHNDEDDSQDTIETPQSPHRESLKEKEERLAEAVKADLSDIRSKVREKLEAARKKKAANDMKTSTNSLGEISIDENYNSDLDPDNEDQSPVMATLVQKISKLRTGTKNGPGFLYVFSDSYEENPQVKIGTSRFPDKRLQQAQVFNPDMWKVLDEPVNQRISALEDLATSLSEYAEPDTKYWFCCNLDIVIEAAHKTASKYAPKTDTIDEESHC